MAELKTNVLQRSVDYAYAMDIDLIHYGFVDQAPVAPNIAYQSAHIITICSSTYIAAGITVLDILSGFSSTPL